MSSSPRPHTEFTFHEDSHDIRQIVAPFGLYDQAALLRQMYDTGAILAGGAATNLCYNQFHPANTTLLHPDSDLDFWVADPTPSPSHARRVYYTLIGNSWDRFLEEAGYESYCPVRPDGPDQSGNDPSGNTTYTDDDENGGSMLTTGQGGGFLSDSGIRLRVRHYQRTDPTETANHRIQLIFYDADPADMDPAATLVSRFDLSICRCLLFASAVNRRWIARAYATQSFREHVLATLNPTISARTEARIQRYLTRYPRFTWYSLASSQTPPSANASG